jgi:hypothetical protein
MPCAKVTMPSCPSHAFVAFVPSIPKLAKRRWGRVVYFNFFLGRSWLVWPHFFLRCGGVSWIRDAFCIRASPRRAHANTGQGWTYAVDSPRWQTSVALAADHLVAVVLGGERLERRLDDATTETEDQVESRLLLDVVVGKGAAILELLASEDQALLVRGNALLVLDLRLNVVYGAVSSCSPIAYRAPSVRTYRFAGFAYQWSKSCQHLFSNRSGVNVRPRTPLPTLWSFQSCNSQRKLNGVAAEGGWAGLAGGDHGRVS